MKSKILLILFLISFLKCFSQTENKFEGIVVYKIEYLTSDLKHMAYGDTMFAYYKEGFIKKIYNCQSNYGIKEEIYNPNINKLSIKRCNNDTIYWRDVSTNGNMTLKQISDSNSSEKILGYKCRKLSSTKEYTYGHYKFDSKQEYFYSEILGVNPSWFKNYKYGFNDKIFQHSKSHYLKYIIDNPDSKVAFVAIKIKHKKLNGNIFKIDLSKPSKEIFY